MNLKVSSKMNPERIYEPWKEFINLEKNLSSTYNHH